MSLSCSISKILPHVQWTWQPVTLRCPSFSIKQLNYEPTCTYRFMYKRIVANTCYIVWATGLVKTLNSKSNLQCQSRSQVLVPFRFLISFLLQLFLYLVPSSIYCYFPKCKKITWPWTNPFGGNLSCNKCTNTRQHQPAHKFQVSSLPIPKIWLGSKNGSRDPDHAHLKGLSTVNYDLLQSPYLSYLKALSLPVTKIWKATQNVENGVIWGT